jgi:hypothetical protein
MKIKIKKTNNDGVVRLETQGDVKEVLINEDFLNPSGESISVCFRGKSSSGIIDFTPEEIERLNKSLKSRMHLVKGIKMLS